MDKDLREFEAELEQLSPGALPEGLISRMEAAMEGWQADEGENEEDKVVPFPQPEEFRPQRSSLWAAAASVAILGALAAFVVTNKSNDEVLVDNPVILKAKAIGVEEADASGVKEEAGPVLPEVSPVHFAPMTAKRRILDTSNGEIIIADGHQVLRLSLLDYVDHVKFQNADGKELHLEIPSRKLRLEPVITD